MRLLLVQAPWYGKSWGNNLFVSKDSGNTETYIPQPLVRKFAGQRAWFAGVRFAD